MNPDAQTVLLITGGSGFVGCNLLHRLLHDAPADLKRPLRVHYTYNSTALDLGPPSEDVEVTAHQLDITDEAAVAEVVRASRPTHVIHLAAMANTAGCEKDPGLADRVNVRGTRHVVAAVEAGRRAGRPCRFVHMSTDWVYDGGLMLREDVRAKGFGVYGASKRAAEEEVRAVCGDYVVLRAALMYGPPAPYRGKASFLAWMGQGLKKTEDAPRLFTDEFRSPIFIADTVEVALRACSLGSGAATTASDAGRGGVDAKMEKTGEKGEQEEKAEAKNGAETTGGESAPGAVRMTINMGGPERICRLDIGKALAAAIGVPCTFTGVRLAELGLDQTRPADLSMDTSLLLAAFPGYSPMPIAAALASCRDLL